MKGVIVERGKDWSGSSDDWQYGKPGKGMITQIGDVPGNGLSITVAWDNGKKRVYNVGVDNKFPLDFVSPGKLFPYKFS